MKVYQLFIGDEHGLRDIGDTVTVRRTTIPDGSIIDPEFGRWIRTKRMAMGISQQDLASLAGVYPADISQYENARKRVTLERRRLIEETIKDLES